jgi:hypothetical protein
VISAFLYRYNTFDVIDRLPQSQRVDHAYETIKIIVPMLSSYTLL